MFADEDMFPYTVRIVSDILESNGSSSMASICGGTLAVLDAGVPLKAPVAGVAMGLVKEGDKYAILTDIAGVEDHYGDMDFKVAGTRAGITALQMDIKIGGIDQEILSRALEQARAGRIYILDKMLEALPEARPSISTYAPRIITIKVPVDKIRDIIGPGGKMIRSIVERTGCKIDVEDDGRVSIASVDETAARKAVAIIEELTATAELNKTYLGKVVRVVDFGAFVEIIPGTDGLLHVSEMSHQRVQDVRISRSGFSPSVIHARKGEAVHLRLTSRDQEHCFAVDAFRIEKRIVPGRTTTVDITPDRAGTFPYYCCLEKGDAADTERGRLVVPE